MKNKLKKLESKKRKNLNFYKYYKYKSTFLDHLYFLRENKQLELKIPLNLLLYISLFLFLKKNLEKILLKRAEKMLQTSCGD